MIELTVLSLFLLSLVGCVVMSLNIVYALIVGFILFFGYMLYKKYSFSESVRISLEGIKGVKNIIIIFTLIGALTALWRAGGTIAYIIDVATKVIRPRFMVLFSFLLPCLLSVLTGTAFGTAATMGVICMMIANSMGIDPVITAGAILSGSFFGDRCSPMSSSASLVSELTGTDIYKNISGMIKTSAVPFIISCAVYIILGFSQAGTGEVASTDIFARSFELSFWCIIPALLIVVLCVLRVNVRISMLSSIIVSVFVCVFCQNMTAAEVLRTIFSGFSADEALPVGTMLNGGGFSSMLNVMAIIIISGTYSSIFKTTGLLDSLKGIMEKLSQKTTPYAATVVASILTNMFSCNQSLAVILAKQLCEDLEPDGEKMAINLENSAIVIAPLTPWSIASAVPLTSVGMDGRGVFFAVYLYGLVIYNLIMSFIGKGKKDEIS
ncbi:MAG: sodium:proton antiporter [Eubacteriaceae bacterium]|nr:sodium:proton antiporter [Eubacteriaceae bacterium]